MTGAMVLWRAGCGASRTSGSEGGPGRRTSRKARTAPWSRPYYGLSGPACTVTPGRFGNFCGAVEADVVPLRCRKGSEALSGSRLVRPLGRRSVRTCLAVPSPSIWHRESSSRTGRQIREAWDRSTAASAETRSTTFALEDL